MDRSQLAEKLIQQEELFFENQEADKKLIDAIPNTVNCVAFVGNRDVYFLDTTHTLEEHLRQIDQWSELEPTIVDKSIYERQLCCGFKLNNGYRLSTYSYAIEELLQYYFKDSCQVKRVASTELRPECAQ